MIRTPSDVNALKEKKVIADAPRKKESHVSHLFELAGKDMWSRRGSFFAAYLMGLMAVAALVLLPWPLKLIIDNVLNGEPLPGMLKSLTEFLGANAISLTKAEMASAIAVAYALIASLSVLCGAAEKMISARIQEGLVLTIREKILAHLQTLSLTTGADHRSGDLVLRMMSDVHFLVRFLTKTGPLIFRYVAVSVFTLAVMFSIEPLLAAMGFIVIVMFAVLVRFYGRKLHRASHNKRIQEGSVTGLAQEIIKGLPTVQALSADNYIRRRFRESNRVSLDAGIKEVSAAVSMERILQIINGFAVALMMGMGAHLVLKNQLTLGDLTVFVAYMIQLLKPIEKINDLATAVTRGLNRGERLAALLHQKPVVVDSPDARPIEHCQGVLEFHSVTFSYGGDDSEKTLLSDINFRLEPGKLTVLTGPSGSGKSTLLSLMLRQVEPEVGMISIDGRPYCQTTIVSLRSQFAVMLQHHHLFAGNIRDAMWLNDAPVDDKRIWDALAQVDMEEHVRQMPNGLASNLSEDGLNFSGGQRARLSLARALLLNRSILVLDEPLANIDARSQRIILNTLELVRSDKTCLVISHQHALIDRADVLLTLENGHVAMDLCNPRVTNSRRVS